MKQKLFALLKTKEDSKGSGRGDGGAGRRVALAGFAA